MRGFESAEPRAPSKEHRADSIELKELRQQRRADSGDSAESVEAMVQRRELQAQIAKPRGTVPREHSRKQRVPSQQRRQHRAESVEAMVERREP